MWDIVREKYGKHQRKNFIEIGMICVGEIVYIVLIFSKNKSSIILTIIRENLYISNMIYIRKDCTID